ncbi:unnamed protein product [Rhizoctonia solani]|uniref:peptidylprolyl isomerase n=1 Tax=Rhizoctonia solani TaxID=456999 RepID=A0A8H3D9A5_9AGAM|nr:unnamed protein product [Rhizoctonia solani]
MSELKIERLKKPLDGTEDVSPKAGDKVLIHYTGTLLDANKTKFDSSHDRKQPFETVIGRGKVIKGWDEGVPQLKLGEKALLTIPPHMGYGARGAGGVIPPNATLCFEVTLLGINDKRAHPSAFDRSF